MDGCQRPGSTDTGQCKPGYGRNRRSPGLNHRNGEVALSGLRTGARDLAVALHQQISKDTKKARRLGKRIQVAITHGDNHAGAAKLRELIERDFENVDIVFTNIINNIHSFTKISLLL